MTQTNSRRARRVSPSKPMRHTQAAEPEQRPSVYVDPPVFPSSAYEQALSHSGDDPFLARELHLSQALAKAAITHLELEALLHALLDPIKDIMAVDNVAILLCSRDGQHLLLHAAHGLEEEAVGHVSVPIGKGFAGRIAASRRPLVVPNLAEFDAVNPVLKERIRSAAGTALVAGDRLLGVLHIGTGQPHDFAIQELEVLQHVADHVALAIDRALRYRTERETREAFERQAQRTREALDALIELAGAIVSSPVAADSPSTGSTATSHEHDDLLVNQLAGLCSRILGCERIAIIGIEPETECLRPIAVVGSSSQQEHDFRSSFGGLTLSDRFGPVVAAEVRSGESVLIDLHSLNPDHPAHILSQRLFLLTPMHAAGALTGYIGVNFGDSADDYTVENRALTHAAAQLIGLVMERQQLARERAEAQADALSWERSKRQLDEFLSVASHELRTPITSAKVNVQIATRLLDRLIQAEEDAATNAPEGTHSASEGARKTLARSRDLLLRANSQFARQERLINDLLDLSRTDAGKLEFRFAACDFVALARDSTEEQYAAHPERIIRFSAPDQPILIEADPDRLVQVADNLLSNAIKYSAPDAPISVCVRAEGAFARYEVTDAGPGLRPEEQQRVWQRYYRATDIAPQPGVGPGLGLGLYISKTIVERHGGQVGVESALGKGSTFWFKIPLLTPVQK